MATNVRKADCNVLMYGFGSIAFVGDVFIHAGDFTKCGRKEEVIEFNTWIGKDQPGPMSLSFTSYIIAVAHSRQST